jgi:hypothetical protein
MLDMTGAEHTPQQAGAHRAEPGRDASIHELQADIERTRHELGATVESLSAKANVIERAKVKARAVAPSVAIVVSISGVTVIGIIWWRRRRR